MIKVTLRLPTQDQYAFIEPQIEVEGIEDAVDEYHRVMGLIRGVEGLPDKDFNEFVDRQLMEQEGNHIEEYEKMSEAQKFAVQTIKRSLKRITSKLKDKE